MIKALSKLVMAITVSAMALALIACGSSATAGPQAHSRAAPPPAPVINNTARSEVPDLRTNTGNRPSNVPAIIQVANSTTAYVLGSGDEVRVNVFGESELSGQFEINGQGSVPLPLIGHIQAAGLTIREFEFIIETALRDGYLHEPQVSVEVLNFRPFFIIGEVNSGGEFPYSHGMTVLNAVATAGGYSYRANERRVLITRTLNGVETEIEATPSTMVQPGDVIRVPQRFF